MLLWGWVKRALVAGRGSFDNRKGIIARLFAAVHGGRATSVDGDTMSAGNNRILIVSEWFFPHRGGSERVAHNCAVALARRGWEVVVYTPSAPGDGEHDGGQPYRVVRSGTWAWTRRLEAKGSPLLNRVARLLAALLVLARCLTGSWHAIIGVHLPVMALPGAILRRLGFRNVHAWALGEELRMGMRSRAMRSQLRLALSASRRVFAISADTARLVGELGYPANRVILQYPAPDALFFKPLAAERAALRARLGLGLEEAEGTLLLVTVSRLVERKGVDTVLRVLATVRDRAEGVAPFLYLIAGTGPYRQHLESLVAELSLERFVRFTGECGEEEKRDLVEAADLFLMPNRELASGEAEGFGIVFVEAALRGTPCIGGRSGGTADAIAEGISGWLVDGTSPGELADRLTMVLREPGCLLPLRIISREWAVGRFTPHLEHEPLAQAMGRPRSR